jgi:hypothetical protein
MPTRSGDIRTVVFSPDSAVLVSATTTGILKSWDVRSLRGRATRTD